jgi:hypothetical protein
LQYFAVFCSPTAFFEHSYTSEQPPFNQFEFHTKKAVSRPDAALGFTSLVASQSWFRQRDFFREHGHFLQTPPRASPFMMRIFQAQIHNIVAHRPLASQRYHRSNATQIFVCFVSFVVPSPPPHIPEHRFLRQFKPLSFDARCCISRKHLVKPEFDITLHHNIRSHNCLRGGPTHDHYERIVAQTSSPIFVYFVSFVVPSDGRYQRKRPRVPVGVARAARSFERGEASWVRQATSPRSLLP